MTASCTVSLDAFGVIVTFFHLTHSTTGSDCYYGLKQLHSFATYKSVDAGNSPVSLKQITHIYFIFFLFILKPNAMLL